MKLTKKLLATSLAVYTVIIPLESHAEIAGNNFSQSTSAIESGLFMNSLGCYGETDYPHISTHVPNTVNVIARTVCPGESVAVRTTLTRHGWFIFNDSSAIQGLGKSRVQVNTSLKCKWKFGMEPIKYVAESVHFANKARFAKTKRTMLLLC